VSTVSSDSSSEPNGVLFLTHEYSFDLAVVAQGEVQLCLVRTSLCHYLLCSVRLDLCTKVTQTDGLRICTSGHFCLSPDVCFQRHVGQYIRDPTRAAKVNVKLVVISRGQYISETWCGQHTGRGQPNIYDSVSFCPVCSGGWVIRL
jgi:hypothetical protein